MQTRIPFRGNARLSVTELVKASTDPSRNGKNIVTVSYTHLRAHETDSYLV